MLKEKQIATNIEKKRIYLALKNYPNLPGVSDYLGQYEPLF